MKLLLIIGTGGFIGTVSRYLTTVIVHKYCATSFPLGTFVINVLGCFLIGVFYGLSERGSIMSAEWRMFLTVGFCGGFTTFSTFANDNLALLHDSKFLYFALYTGLSVMLGLFATYFGNMLTKCV